jgi:hypothetical protein
MKKIPVLDRHQKKESVNKAKKLLMEILGSDLS